MTDNLDPKRSMTYSYDAWSRLQTATAGPTAAPTWKLSWDYDRFGNRKNQNVLAGTAPAPQLAINESTDRITGDPGFSYDLGGNLTNDALNTYSYDAESRIKTVNGPATSYSYDGGGLRLEKVAGGTTTVYVFSGTKVIAEYVNGAAVNAPTREYIYAGSQLLATIEGGATKYHHPDHLSTRLLTDSTGAVVAQQGHYPFGESWYQGAGGTKWQFTSYERDSESLLDYATFRYDASRLGRFMTPDPVAGSTIDPQSLNRYAYVRNDPANLIDPLGLQAGRPCHGSCDNGCAPTNCHLVGEDRCVCDCNCSSPVNTYLPPIDWTGNCPWCDISNRAPLIGDPGGAPPDPQPEKPKAANPPKLPNSCSERYDKCTEKAWNDYQRCLKIGTGIVTVVTTAAGLGAGYGGARIGVPLAPELGIVGGIVGGLWAGRPISGYLICNKRYDRDLRKCGDLAACRNQ